MKCVMMNVIRNANQGLIANKSADLSDANKSDDLSDGILHSV